MPYRDREQRNAYARAWYAKNAGVHKELTTRRAKEDRKKIRAILDELKSQPCTDCDGRFDPVCMDFDHVTGVKLFNVSSGSTSYKLEKVLEEVAKCEIVCANCHRLRTKMRRSK